MEFKLPQLTELTEKVGALEKAVEHLTNKVLPANTYLTPRQLEERYHISPSTRKRLERSGVINKKKLGGKSLYDPKEIEQAII